MKTTIVLLSLPKTIFRVNRISSDSFCKVISAYSAYVYDEKRDRIAAVILTKCTPLSYPTWTELA